MMCLFTKLELNSVNKIFRKLDSASSWVQIQIFWSKIHLTQIFLYKLELLF
jgi:hypothetical protein